MEFKFNEENQNKLNTIISHYPVKKAAVMGALWLAQEQSGWISGEVMKEVANQLEMTLEEVVAAIVERLAEAGFEA